MSSGGSEANDVKVGKWYLCAICRTCQRPIPILEIQKDAAISGDGTFSFRDVPCQDCGAKHDYPLNSLQRLQAQPMGRLQ
jgi:RNase P subunit RPR2